MSRVVNIEKPFHSFPPAALSQYAAFVSQVRETVASGYTLDEAIEISIRYCIENGIMKEYLAENSDEVRRMLNFEWDDETYERVIRAESRDEGREEGRAEAVLETARKLKTEGAEIVLIRKVTGLSAEEIDAL